MLRMLFIMVCIVLVYGKVSDTIGVQLTPKGLRNLAKQTYSWAKVLTPNSAPLSPTRFLELQVPRSTKGINLLRTKETKQALSALNQVIKFEDSKREVKDLSFYLTHSPIKVQLDWDSKKADIVLLSHDKNSLIFEVSIPVKKLLVKAEWMEFCPHFINPKARTQNCDQRNYLKVKKMRIWKNPELGLLAYMKFKIDFSSKVPEIYFINSGIATKNQHLARASYRQDKNNETLASVDRIQFLPNEVIHIEIDPTVEFETQFLKQYSVDKSVLKQILSEYFFEYSKVILWEVLDSIGDIASQNIKESYFLSVQQREVLPLQITSYAPLKINADQINQLGDDLGAPYLSLFSTVYNEISIWPVLNTFFYHQNQGVEAHFNPRPSFNGIELPIEHEYPRIDLNQLNPNQYDSSLVFSDALINSLIKEAFSRPVIKQEVQGLVDSPGVKVQSAQVHFITKASGQSLGEIDLAIQLEIAPHILVANKKKTKSTSWTKQAYQDLIESIDYAKTSLAMYNIETFKIPMQLRLKLFKKGEDIALILSSPIDLLSGNLKNDYDLVDDTLNYSAIVRSAIVDQVNTTIKDMLKEMNTEARFDSRQFTFNLQEISEPLYGALSPLIAVEKIFIPTKGRLVLFFNFSELKDEDILQYKKLIYRGKDHD